MKILLTIFVVLISSGIMPAKSFSVYKDGEFAGVVNTLSLSGTDYCLFSDAARILGGLRLDGNVASAGASSLKSVPGSFYILHTDEDEKVGLAQMSSPALDRSGKVWVPILSFFESSSYFFGYLTKIENNRIRLMEIPSPKKLSPFELSSSASEASKEEVKSDLNNPKKQKRLKLSVFSKPENNLRSLQSKADSIKNDKSPKLDNSGNEENEQLPEFYFLPKKLKRSEVEEIRKRISEENNQ